MNDVLAGHEPTTELGDGRERCSADGYLWPCPDVRQQPAPVSAEDRVLIAMIDVGWAAWERIPEDSERTVRGGLVVEANEDEHGRMFTIVHSPGGRHELLRLHESMVAAPGPDDLPNAAYIRSRARRMQEEASRTKGVSDGWELRLTKYALVLLESIA